MKRNHLLSLLFAYQPTDTDERYYKETIITFIQNNPDCFERSLEMGHITASAWLLNKDHSHALLMHHKKLDCWLQLGGHCDGDSDVLAVALKEAREESGIMHIDFVSPTIFDIDVHLLPGKGGQKDYYHYDIRFLLQVMSDEVAMHNEESHGLRWIAKHEQELPTTARSVVRMFEKWCSL